MHKVGAILASNLLAVCPRYPLPPPPLTPDPEPYLLPISVSSEIVTTFFFFRISPTIYLFIYFFPYRETQMVDSAKEIDAGWLDSKMVMYGFFFSLIYGIFFIYTQWAKCNCSL